MRRPFTPVALGLLFEAVLDEDGDVAAVREPRGGPIPPDGPDPEKHGVHPREPLIADVQHSHDRDDHKRRDDKRHRDSDRTTCASM